MLGSLTTLGWCEQSFGRRSFVCPSARRMRWVIVGSRRRRETGHGSRVQRVSRDHYPCHLGNTGTVSAGGAGPSPVMRCRFSPHFHRTPTLTWWSRAFSSTSSRLIGATLRSCARRSHAAQHRNSDVPSSDALNLLSSARPAANSRLPNRHAAAGRGCGDGSMNQPLDLISCGAGASSGGSILKPLSAGNRDRASIRYRRSSGDERPRRS